MQWVAITSDHRASSYSEEAIVGAKAGRNLFRCTVSAGSASKNGDPTHDHLRGSLHVTTSPAEKVSVVTEKWRIGNWRDVVWQTAISHRNTEDL